MPGILGLRDSESDEANRFKNWRRRILYEFPNGDAPLTALLSITDEEETNDASFHWFNKSLETQRTTASANYTNVANTINLTASIVRVGHLIKNETTDEIMKVTSVDSTGLVIGVLRGKWGAAQAGVAAEAIVVIGNSNPEGGDVPQIITYDPTDEFNYTQIFRTPFGMTRTYMKTSLKYDRSGPYIEKMREALNFHSIEMEKAFIFGRRGLYVDPATNKIERTTDGLIARIPADNIIDLAAGSTSVDGVAFDNAPNTIDQNVMDAFLELAFRTQVGGRSEKLVLGGSGALAALNTMAKLNGHMNIDSTQDAYGFAFRKYITPFGTLWFYTHPLFTQHPVWRYWMLIVDIHGLKYRYLTDSDTKRLTQRQNPGQDQRIDEFLTECGLEIHHPKAFGLIKNVRRAGCFECVPTSTTTTTTGA